MDRDRRPWNRHSTFISLMPYTTEVERRDRALVVFPSHQGSRRRCFLNEPATASTTEVDGLMDPAKTLARNICQLLDTVEAQNRSTPERLTRPALHFVEVGL